MTGPYDDIINLPHPTSLRHPRMSRIDRAAQFSPFAALSGHHAALEETARLTDRRVELSEEETAALDRKLCFLLEHIVEQPEITVSWFHPDEKKDGGRYAAAAGKLKRIDTAARVLVLTDGTRIPLGDIADIESGILPES